MRWIVRAYPRRWRQRYGEEVADLLGWSDRPGRDGFNVARHAVVTWLEVPVIRISTTVAAGLSLVLFGFTVGQLARGVGEIADHWWSSGALAMAAATVSAAAIGHWPGSDSQRFLRLFSGRTRDGLER